MIDRISNAYGRFLAGLSLLGCTILLAMMFIIVADVALRNLAIPGLPQGLEAGGARLAGDGDAAHPICARGSMMRWMMASVRFVMTTRIATTKTMHCNRMASCRWIACKARKPIPGQAKTDSTTME